MTGITVIYELYFIAKKNKHLYKIITFLTILEIFVFAIGCVGIQEKYRGGSDHSDYSIFEANDLIKEMPNIDEGMYKYKDADSILLENTALVTRLPSISSWLLTTKEQVNAHKLLGYTKYDFKIDSSGGTIFSDSLLNAKYVFTKDIYSNSLYNKITSMDNGKVNLYELKNSLPVGLVFDNKANSTEIPSELTDLEIQNYLYKNLFNKNDDLIEVLKAQDIVQNKEKKQITEKDDGTLLLDMKTNNELNFNIDVQGTKKIYLNVENLGNSKVFFISVNEKIKSIHTMNDYRYQTHGYPNTLNNGILDLGTYSNETVTIQLITNGKTTCDSIEFGLFDIDKYNNVCQEATKTTVSKNDNGSDIKIETVAKEGQKMFLPIAYDKNWKCYVNGKQEDVQKIFTGFISFDLVEGQNNIELKYENNTFNYGMIISIIGIFLFLIMFFINKNDRFIKNKIIKNITYIIFLCVLITFYLVVYGYGIFKSILNGISIIFNIC